MKKIVMLLALLLVPTVYAQLDWSITDLRCGNGKMDQFELCEKDLENESICEKLGENLTIAMACFDKHCTCVPKVNPVYCGNKRRDFIEMCDAGDPDDRCPMLGQLMGNLTLKCNPKTCGCDIADIPVDYSPNVVEQFKNATQKTSSCGNKKVERNEDCDPPNTLCTTSTKDPGVCSKNCECLSPDQLGEEENKEEATPSAPKGTAENLTEDATPTETPKTEAQKEEPGFFSRLWDWLAGLFN